MSSDNAVVVKNLSKTFKLPHERTNSLKQTVLSWHRRQFEELNVLKNISFEVKRGQFFGIVGRNGSGKSSLLKTLAGIYTPSSGDVLINGQLTPFIELGVGFNPELTGRDNVFLNGVILGLARSEISAKYDEIVAFAELEKFMDQKLKNYSSGMQVRLAFAIAIQAHNDILLIDEVLAVGDENFQNKCLGIFREIKKSAKTVIFVTHDMSLIEKFCDRALVINEGESLGVYKPLAARQLYAQLNEPQMLTETKQKPKQRWGTHEVRVESVKLLTADGRESRRFRVGDTLSIKINLKSSTKTGRKILVGLAIYDNMDTYLSGPNSSHKLYTSNDKEIVLNIHKLPLNVGYYTLTVAVFDQYGEKTYDHLEKFLQFRVENKDPASDLGKVVLDYEWK